MNEIVEKEMNTDLRDQCANCGKNLLTSDGKEICCGQGEKTWCHDCSPICFHKLLGMEEE